MKKHSYDSYRGRTSSSTLLKGLIVVLAVILGLCIAGYIVMQNYMVYTEDGGHIKLPFFQQQEVENTDDPASENIVIETQPVETEPVETQPVGEETITELRAVLLPATAITDGSVQTRLAAAGADAAVFDMKADDGSLGYVSTVADKASAQDETLNAAIRALNESGVYTVARVSCFKDNLMAEDTKYAILTNSGYRWRDENEIRWISPTNEAVQNYLVGIVTELAALGFDEILLDHAGYPTTGHLGYIKVGAAYDAAAFESVIAAFYGKVSAALEESGVKLSIVATQEAILGTDVKSGQTASDLAQWADRVWMPSPTDGSNDYEALLTAAGMENTAGQVVFIGQQLGESGSWAVLQ